MSEAYYVPGDTGTGQKIPIGEYEAIITSLDVAADIKCGRFIADIFKPTYKMIHPDYSGMEVKDNGIFRYKEKTGYEYKPSRNWGFAKFCKALGLEKEEGGKITLPYLEFNSIDGFKVIVSISYKNFVNDTGSQVSYPVAILKSKLAEVPF